jgi:hypothetical protein
LQLQTCIAAENPNSDSIISSVLDTSSSRTINNEGHLPSPLPTPKREKGNKRSYSGLGTHREESEQSLYEEDSSYLQGNSSRRPDSFRRPNSSHRTIETLAFSEISPIPERLQTPQIPENVPSTSLTSCGAPRGPRREGIDESNILESS